MVDTEKEYYWSLIIEPGWVQAGIWSLDLEMVNILSMSNAVAWSLVDGSESDEDTGALIEAADSVLSSSVTDFPEGAKEPSKTVFGVPPSWVSEGQIEKKYLAHLREICSKLSLTPGGFVILPEAIAHSVKLNEGAPLTGVIVGVGKSVIDVTLFRLGNLVGTVNVGRSVSVIDDLVEGLTRFKTGEHIPSRIMLYDGKEAELEEVRQQLAKADWENGLGQGLKFLHEPKIEIVAAKEKIVAVCTAGASEMGEVRGVSVLGEEKEQASEEANVVSSDAELSAQDVGFVVGGDVSEVQSGAVEEQVPDLHTEGSGRKLGITMTKLKEMWMKWKPAGGRRGLPTMRMPGMSKGRMPLLAGGGVVVLLFVLVGLWWYLPRADIAVYVAPKELSESVFVSFDEGVEAADLENFVLPAETVRVSVSGSGSRSATGSRLTGERAKGEVTIRNGTSSGINLTSEVILVGPNELKFSVDKEASVSAAVSPSSPGTLTVEVVAGDIGAEYNLAQGETMEVGNYPKSEVDALVEADISGGSSEEVTAVSKEDLEKLEDEIGRELFDDGERELLAKAGSGVEIVSEALRQEVTERKFSADSGDTVGSVDLDLTMDIIGLVVSRDSLLELARDTFEGQVPDGFTLLDSQIEIEFVFEGEGDGVWDFEVAFGANLLPEVDPEEVAGKVAGKYPPRAQEYLMTIPGFSRAEIKLKPSLPGKLGVIPWVKSHVGVEVVADK